MNSEEVLIVPSKKQKLFDCILIFLICFVPRLIMAVQSYPMAYLSDETSSFSIAAAIAGYNWDDVVSNAGYYGIGFLWIFGLLFKINLSPIVIYRVTLSVLAGVNALTGPLFYGIMNRFFHVQSRFKKIIVSSICGTLIFLYVVILNVHNEEILALLVCIIAFLLCKIVEERKFRDEILLSLVMLYSLTCHTRAIAILLTVLAVSILYSIFYRKKLFHIVTYIINIAGYIVIYYFLNLYRSSVWGSGTVRNSSVSSSVGNAMSSILGTGNWADVIKSWGRIVAGQMFTASTITGGLFLVATIICIAYLICFFKRKEKNNSEKLFVITLTALILVYATMIVQGITWLPGVYNGIYVSEQLSYIDSYRAFTYMRYFGAYVPLLVMIAVSIGETESLLIKRSALIALPCYLVLLLLWVNFIQLFIDTSKRPFFYLLSGLTHENTIASWNWVMLCILGTFFATLYLILTQVNRFEIALTVSLVLLVSEQIYTNQNSTKFTQENNFSKADGGYILIQNMSDMLGEDIYVSDQSSNTDHQIFYLYQFLNYTYHVIPTLPDDTEEDFILFTNKKVEFEERYIDGYQLDDNEYVYTNVQTYSETIQDLGYDPLISSE